MKFRKLITLYSLFKGEKKIAIEISIELNVFYYNCNVRRKALKNFEQCVKPGGMLLIDHRNYDYIIDKGATPAKSIYYNVSIIIDLVIYLFHVYIDFIILYIE